MVSADGEFNMGVAEAVCQLEAALMDQEAARWAEERRAAASGDDPTCLLATVRHPARSSIVALPLLSYANVR